MQKKRKSNPNRAGGGEPGGGNKKIIMDWGGARGDRVARELEWVRTEGCQAGGQNNAPGHGRELLADGLGGKQRPAATKTKTR